MNNKGFAITSILYGLLVLFLLVILSLIGILNEKRQRTEKLSESASSAIQTNEINLNVTSNNYVTNYRGKYIVSVNGTCTIEKYLPRAANINSGTVLNNCFSKDNCDGITEANISSIKIEKVYTSVE